MDDGIYVPLSERTLRKLDQLEQIMAAAGDGYTEDRIVSMGLDNLLASLREFDNDNSAPPPRTRGFIHSLVARLVGSNHNDSSDSPATLPPVALSTEDAGTGEPAGL
jgi:hypothetical protein